MGGEYPIWGIIVESGNLERVNEGWMYKVGGRGKGKLHWQFANGKATSNYLYIDLE